jgi:iron complex outermembrane recepter protein
LITILRAVKRDGLKKHESEKLACAENARCNRIKNMQIRCFKKLSGAMLGLAIAFAPKTNADELTPAPSDAGKTNSDVLTTYKKMSLEELMNQEVTSVAKQPEPLGHAPAAIQVVTGDEIRRSGASSIPEALRLADNLEVAQINSHDWAISARGFNSHLGDKLLVLMDGRAVYSPLYGGVLWNMQDYLLEDIDRIEVISGPGGTLWGANAVNGVINITTKNAKDTQGFYLEAGGGNELQDFTGVRYGGMLSSNVYYRVYGKFYNLNDEHLPNGNDAADATIQGQGGFRIDTEPSLPNVFTLQGNIFDGQESLDVGGVATNEIVGGGNVLGRWSHTISDDSEMSLQAYYDRTHLEFPYVTLGTLSDDLDTADVEFQHNFSLGARNKFVWGLGYRFTHEVDQNSAAPGSARVIFMPSTLDQNLFNVFGQDEIRLLDQLYLTLGTKIEHNDYTGFEFEPNVRLQWTPTPKQMFWGAISRAVRTPSRLDHDLKIPSGFPPPFQMFEAGNSDFESEGLIAYELGYRAQLGAKISASVSAFYNDYNNLRSLSPGPPPFLLPFTFANNLKGDTYGFEMSADYQIFNWWRLHGGYDFLQENIYVKPGQVDLDNALDETADPRNQVFLRSSMDLPWRTELDVNWRWIDKVVNDNNGVAGTVPAYAEMDVRLGWHATKNLEISIVGQNLLHDQHPEAGFPGPAQEQIVRSVYGKVTWRF